MASCGRLEPLTVRMSQEKVQENYNGDPTILEIQRSWDQEEQQL